MRRDMRPVLRGNSYAISTRKPQASQVAERVLRAGGNAFDAAVAAQAVLAVTDPAMTGIGGDAAVLLYDASHRQVLAINAAGTAPMLATIGWYNENAGGKIPANNGLLSASFPSVIDASYLLLDRWGTLTFAELLAPAIELAEQGFPVSEYLVEYLETYSGKLQQYPTTNAIYFPEGKTLRPGENLRNRDLARTLRRLTAAEQQASAGGRRAGLRAARDCFYRGEIAREMAAFLTAQGGLYRYEDFANYSAVIEEPVSANYRGYDVYKNASSNQGPTELILLNLLEGFDLRSMGHNSRDYIHTCAEAAKLAYADRERYLGDADFVPIPFAGLLSKQYASERRALIDREVASLDLRPGAVHGRLEAAELRQASINFSGAAQHEGDTSFLAIVDQHGNAVAFTPSLHSAFGTGVVIDGLGFILNCRGDFYELDPAHTNALAPGKRTRSTLTPTIVMKDGALSIVLGSPGGDDQVLRVTQTFLNIVDFGMNVQQAIEAPRWSTTSFPASEFPHTMYPGHLALEDRIAPSVRSELERSGHRVEITGPWVLGATSVIAIDPETGVLSAGADPRGDNYALAW